MPADLYRSIREQGSIMVPCDKMKVFSAIYRFVLMASSGEA
jgi:hypothetical protein